MAGAHAPTTPSNPSTYSFRMLVVYLFIVLYNCIPFLFFTHYYLITSTFYIFVCLGTYLKEDDKEKGKSESEEEVDITMDH